jgi:hypothetical protein
MPAKAFARPLLLTPRGGGSVLDLTGELPLGGIVAVGDVNALNVPVCKDNCVRHVGNGVGNER